MLLISVHPPTRRAYEGRMRPTDAGGSRRCSRFLSHSQNLRDLQVLTITSIKLVKYASFIDTVSATSPISIVLQLVYLFRGHQAEGKWPKTARGDSAICPGPIHLFSLSFAHAGALWVCKQNLTCPLAKCLANVKKMLYIAITLKQ